MSNNSAESTLNFCTTIIANPDISGIGVRVSIYAGAILNIVTSIITMNKGDEAATTEAHRNSCLTSMGLVISTIIEWKTQGLSLFDGLLVTMLSTLMVSWVPSRPTYSFSHLCSIILYNTFVGYWGIQVWLDPSTFGIPLNEENCTASSQTIFVLFGRNLPPSNRWLRGLVLFYFGLTAAMLPLSLLVFCLKKFWRVPKALSRSRSGPHGPDERRKQIADVLGVLSVAIYMMITIEQIVERNPVKAQLNKWTFGQTLALIMLIQQLIACLSLFKKYYLGGKHAKSSASSPEDGAVPPVPPVLLYQRRDEGESEK